MTIIHLGLDFVNSTIYILYMAPDIGFDYDPDAYPPFAVTVDVAVFTIRGDELQVLLIERGGEPYLGALALPGGFVRPDEDLDQAAARELAEETGLRAGSWHLEQLASYGTPDRDPRMRVVTVAYWAICAELPGLRGGGDAAAALLMPVKKIESGERPPGVRPRADRKRRRRAHAVEARVHRPGGEVLSAGVHDRTTSPRLRGGLEHPPRSRQLPAQRSGKRRFRETSRCGGGASFAARAPGGAVVRQ